MRTREEMEALIAKFERDMSKRTRGMRFLLVLDQMLNVLWLNGSQDETVSSHLGRKKESGTITGFQSKICCILNKLEHNHCKLSKGE